MFLFGRKKRKDALEALMDSITEETQSELEAYEKSTYRLGVGHVEAIILLAKLHVLCMTIKHIF